MGGMHQRGFQRFYTDEIVISKPGGEVLGVIRASVQSKGIYFDDPHLPIEIGDRISRSLPNGVVERYIIEDTGYHRAFHNIPAHYQMKVRREGAAPHPSPVQYQVTGANARINIASVDASYNVNEGGTEALFEALKRALQSIGDIQERARVLDEADALREEVGKPSFAERYRRFIASAAAHIEIIAPFVAPLTALIPHG
jgi:hypothetical protein